MSGSEEQINHGHQLIGVLRSLIIAGMMACVIVSLVGLVQRIAPYWPGGYLAVLAFLVCLEGIASERLLKGRSLDSTSRLQLRAAEGVIIMIALRLVLSLLLGWDNLVRDAYRWLANPGAIFDLAYLITSVVLVAVWYTSVSLANDLLTLETCPADVPAPPITSDEYWLWITRPRDKPDTRAAMRHLNSTFLGGGILLLLFAGLSRLDVELVTRLAHPSTPGIIINACRYWRPGSSRRKPGGGKIQTPALTLPQVRVLIAGLLNRLLKVHQAERIRRTVNRRLKRNEEARLYHWRRRKRLPPRRFDQRT